MPFAGPAYQTRALSQNNQECVNWYALKNEVAGKAETIGKSILSGGEQYVLQGTPGLKSFSTSSYVVGRGCYKEGNLLYAVLDNKFVEINSAGTQTVRGTLATTDGPVQFASISDQIIVVDGDAGWHYTISTNTFTKINQLTNAPGFPSAPRAIAAAYSYFVVVNPDSDQFNISYLDNGLCWDAVDFATAEQQSDYLMNIVLHLGDLWMLGTQNVEIWGAVSATTPFQKRAGIAINYGCAARYSLAKGENSLFWLATSNLGSPSVVISKGYEVVPISSQAIAYQLSTYTTIDDAIGFVYSMEGQEFYVLSFPTEQVTWMYNLTTGLWNKWGWWNTDINSFEHILASSHQYAFGKHLVTDRKSGNILELDNGTYTDNGDVIRRVRSSPILFNNREFISLYNFNVEIETGVGLTTGQGSAPELLLRVSKDGGRTYGNYLSKTVGILGNYTQRALWPSLGGSKAGITVELSVSDPVQWTILNVSADIE